jgi:hypothetical protein
MLIQSTKVEESGSFAKGHHLMDDLLFISETPLMKV